MAQYYGAERHERTGPALWQGFYVAALGGALILLFVPMADSIFRLAGHTGLVKEYETVYFRILCLGAAPPIATSAMAGFFCGIGKPWPVMWANVLATAVNLVLDYVLIFGRCGLPPMGIRGAAIATVISGCVAFAAYFSWLCLPAYRRRYRTVAGWRFEGALFLRLLRHGLPNGVQFFLDMAGFTAFTLVMGGLGTRDLAATSIALNINSLAFMPMIGVGIAVTVLVGQHLGGNRPDAAERSAYSGFHVAFVYMAAIAAAYVLVPDLFVFPFRALADPKTFPAVRRLVVVLLRFVAFYCLFDALNIIFASVLKGAGDTRFVMLMLAVISATCLVFPCYVALRVLRMGIYAGWTIATAYVVILGVAFLLRFLGGRWKSMRVIEEAPKLLPPTMAESPTGEI